MMASLRANTNVEEAEEQRLDERMLDSLQLAERTPMELVLVMNLTMKEASQKRWTMGAAAAIMIDLCYRDEHIMETEKLACHARVLLDPC